MLAFNTVLKTSFQLLRCEDVEEKSVLFVAGTASCGEAWQSALFVAVGLLVISPIGLAVLARRHCHDRASPVFKTLISPYRLWWWCAPLLLQRLVLVSVAVFIKQPVTRGGWMFIVCMLILLLNIYMHPFRRNPTHLISTALLVVLTTAAGLNAVAGALLFHVSAHEVQARWGLSMAYKLALTVPVVIYLAVVAIIVMVPLTPSRYQDKFNRLMFALESRYGSSTVERQQTSMRPSSPVTRFGAVGLTTPGITTPGIELAVLNNNNNTGTGTSGAHRQPTSMRDSVETPPHKVQVIGRDEHTEHVHEDVHGAGGVDGAGGANTATARPPHPQTAAAAEQGNEAPLTEDWQCIC